MPQPCNCVFIFTFTEKEMTDMKFESGHKLAIDSGELKR